jgi:VIT1/CCC1 family predicted Fe2+/Mn2+ transporter/rubrerythrin
MGQATVHLTPEERARSLANLKLERDAVVLYDRLAEIEKQPDRAAAFRRIAANERRHAEIWANRLGEAGATVPPVSGPRARVRLIILVARLFGTNAVADLVRALEGDEEEAYASQLTPETASIAADEREHAEIWDRLTAGDTASADGSEPTMADNPAAADDAGAARAADAGAAARARRLSPAAQQRKTRDEAWHHRGGRSGTLRAAVFGANDGLVSNLSLVMGVAGAAQDNHVIVLAGIAGLLAGSFSMAAGEYISMQSQRELFEKQIETEREEMRVMPDVERAELIDIYRAKGLPEHEAEIVADRLMEDPDKALDTMIREELGLDPDELGSPWGAAWSSFVSFGVGAFIPLLPFLLGSGSLAFVSALTLSFAGLFAVGAGVSLLTGRGFWFSGLRQVIIGAAAAAVTFAVGTVIGANVT